MAAILWLIIITALGVTYKYFIRPNLDHKLQEKTSSKSPYKAEVRLQLDSFSGYVVLRSEFFRNLLKKEGVRLILQDDQGDIFQRHKALASKRADFAVFTVDSYLLTGLSQGFTPSTIIAVIDESKGADAIVTKNPSIKSIQDLNNLDTRILLTPNSPSDFLTKVVVSQLNLDNLHKNFRQEHNGAAEIYRQLSRDSTTERKAYVLWEPYVTMAREAGASILIDSSSLSGYIVDVLVARREFLDQKPHLSRMILKAYFEALFNFQANPHSLLQTLKKDAVKTGSPLLNDQKAEALSRSIDWRNTLNNYAHFGLNKRNDMEHIEDIMSNILEVLQRTGSAPNQNILDQFPTFYFDALLREMNQSDFHPQVQKLTKSGKRFELSQLTRQQWEELRPVAELKIAPIIFARGSSRINVQSYRNLKELSRKLKAWPRFYCLVRGHARGDGDAEANLKLAESRARAALKALLEGGVDSARLNARAEVREEDRSGASQSVSFLLMEKGY